MSAGVGLAVFGGLLWLQPDAHPTLLAATVTTAEQTLPPPGSATPTATGLVGTGGTTPLLARTAGQVEDVFFAAGDYARRGQLLVKLSNHTFVLAPRAGFLGPAQVKMGQYITKATPVTTLSRYSHLVVPVQLPSAWRDTVHPGDSVLVWATARPGRLVGGVVGPLGQPSTAANAPVEILLTSRAPLRIGERASVGLPTKSRPLVVR